MLQPPNEFGWTSPCWQSSHLQRWAISSLTHSHNSRLEVEEHWEQSTHTALAQVWMCSNWTALSIALSSIYTSLVPTIWHTSTWLSSAFNYYYMADVCHYIVGLLPYSYCTIDGQQELATIPTLCCTKRSKGSSRLSYTPNLFLIALLACHPWIVTKIPSTLFLRTLLCHIIQLYVQFNVETSEWRKQFNLVQLCKAYSLPKL